MKLFTVLLTGCLLSSVLLAQPGVSHADGLFLELPLQPGEGDRFQLADFSFWLADPSQPVRGVIIHQHGCTNASPAKHPPVTHDFHWRALARKHHFALLSPQYQVAGKCDEWNNPDSGSERALLTALSDFATRSKRPELSDVPWVLWGHSGGSSWSAQMITRHPQRVLAASFRGGCHKQFGDPAFRASFAPLAKDIPMLFVWGKRETARTSSHYVSWEPMNAMRQDLRSLGGHVARVIDPRSEHGCDDSRLLVIPFFDAVLSARLSGQTMPGALVDMASIETLPVTPENTRNPELGWLPNREIAALWQEFSKTGTLSPSTPPHIAPTLTATRLADGTVSLNWGIVPELAGGLRAIRLNRDGKLLKELGVKPDAYIATSRDAPPEGLRAPSFIDASPASGTDPVYTLTFLDAAGHESPPSPPAKVMPASHQ
ncbi:hypothetical protein EI77_04046 [Prosthecobacter fusiformis]|uniref:Uncharacterized protein n=1 Tax=Prosthecobacter fusiformis TaxID=48464 RepID=A0A4R7RLQ5_9BACT|nr:hypothetical protein [Prosthecobacter fusiformis]TDU64595.1 hypothetical protein EI77_04046 [Prosthecobacter fusiformis]